MNLNCMTLSPRYKRIFHWMDGTVGYLPSPRVPHTGLCTRMRLDFESYRYKLITIDCDRQSIIVKDYVCEHKVKTKINGQSNAPVALVNPMPPDESSHYVTCPLRHVTHQFLSCDLVSACWVQDERSALPCGPLVNPAPPMFSCSSGTEHVPYSLVCDYRPDCRDHSDEDFCVFPESYCLSGSFHCGNQQVNELCFSSTAL